MKLANLDLNPNTYENRIGELLDSIPISERLNWKQHTCTKVIILEMQRQIVLHILAWIEGQTSAESFEEFAQRNAKALGSIQILEYLVNEVDEMCINNIGENDD